MICGDWRASTLNFRRDLVSRRPEVYGSIHRALAHPIELCTRHILANSSIDRRAQLQIADKRFAVLDFRQSLPNPRLQSDGKTL